jgi:tetratricopeptide (TPR) repeat protein
MAFDRNKLMDYFQDQHFDEAVAYLLPIVSSDPSNIHLLGYLGYAYYMQDLAGAARTCYDRIVSLDPVNLTALYYLAILYRNVDTDTALGFATRLLALQPAKPSWWLMKGQLFQRKNLPDSALEYLTHAYQLAPNDPKNGSALADMLIDKKWYPLADSILDTGLARDSMNTTFLKLRIRSAYQAGDYPAALEPGERLIRTTEPLVNPLTWLALSYYNLKKYPDCIRVCEYMLGQGFELESIYYYEARAKAKMQQYPESNQLLSICLGKAISHTAEWYYYDLANNYEALKEYRLAIANYDTAFYLFKDPTMLYNCGRISETGLKNNVLARKYYNRYLALAHPTSPGEKKAYAYTRERWGIRTGRKGK